MRKLNLYLGAAASSLLLSILVILGELLKPFKNFLASIFTHHWVAKIVLITLAFIIFSFFLGNKNKIFGFKDADAAWYSTLAATIAILLFYVMEYFL